MGLDMYLRGEKFFWTNWEKPEENRKEDDKEVYAVQVRLGYWRKHPNLHGYIVKTFANGKDDCQQIDLSEDDLKQIIEFIQSKKIRDENVTGFFFGVSYWTSDGLPLTEEQERQNQEIDDEAIATFTSALEWSRTEEKGVSRSVFYKASW